MDLSYSNGQKRYDFSTDAGFYYPGCNPMYFHISDPSPKGFRRGYVAALFVEDERWLTDIEKHRLVVPGSPKNPKVQARDLTVKARLQEQVSPSTYKDRKAYYEAWMRAPSCADDCDRFCDECSNEGIKFKSVPTYGLDLDVRRFISKHGRFQTASELKEEDKNGKENSRLRSTTILPGVRDRKSDDDAFWIRGQERGGLFSEPEEVSSDQAERVETMLSHPLSEEMVT